MSIRFDDTSRTLTISVHDLVDQTTYSGHLTLELAQTPLARMALGRAVHVGYQGEQNRRNPAYQAEVSLKRQLVVDGWTVVVVGRADGLVREADGLVVEELKTTALDGFRLLGTGLSDWPRYLAQLKTYVWMLAGRGEGNVTGRLLFVSLVDSTRHILTDRTDVAAVDARIREHIRYLLDRRMNRQAWLARRQDQTVLPPFNPWRTGQERIAEGVEKALADSSQLLIEAPTGLGKTAAILYGVLRAVTGAHGQVFWATARTTQQEVVERTAGLFASAGLSLRVVTLRAKDKACLNDVVACRPEVCPFANRYYDKVRQERVLEKLWAHGTIDADTLADHGTRYEVCPYQLGMDAAREADLVVGDYNYAFDPERSILFAEEARDWVVVADEAHQLVERARQYASPRLAAALPLKAAVRMGAASPERYASFIALARRIADSILEAGEYAEGAIRDGLAQVQLSLREWKELVERVDELALDYARLKSDCPIVDVGELDPWLETARALMRFERWLRQADEDTISLVDMAPGRQAVRLLCLDPSRLMGERLACFGGFIGCSATMSPMGFYRDLLGLESARLERIDASAIVPVENRQILISPRISTAYRDRQRDAPATAALIAQCLEVIPGNVAVYFPSFAMLNAIVELLPESERDRLVQRPDMSETQRRDWLNQLADGTGKTLLAAVLGGVFSEGIDLSPGALRGIIIVGPALPPVGLERDLLNSCYEERYGEGFRYASLIPGMTKVIQAAGRLWRRPEDRGTIVLVGRRFRWREYAAMLPDWWNPEVPEDAVGAIRRFWESA